MSKVAIHGVTDGSVACLRVCNSGYFTLEDESGCETCSVAESEHCSVGEFLKDCGPGLDWGTCSACPPTEPGNFFTGTRCEQAKCADRETKQCPPGTYLVGCGGVESGTCIPCFGGLPESASSWTKNCDFMCQIGTFREENECVKCDTASQCPAGTKLVGCGADGVTKGNCVDCPRAAMGYFYELQCMPKVCNPNVCANDERLAGCGYGLPGTCESCGRLPAGVNSFARKYDDNTNQVLECLASCKEGYFPVENTCKACDHAICPLGQYLAGCGAGDHPGQCKACDVSILKPDELWTGGPDCETGACEDVPECNEDEHRTSCGTSGPAKCVKCDTLKPLPTGALRWTKWESETCIPLCMDGSTLIDTSCVEAVGAVI
jgi:hypothetical protein